MSTKKISKPYQVVALAGGQVVSTHSSEADAWDECGRLCVERQGADFEVRYREQPHLTLVRNEGN